MIIAIKKCSVPEDAVKIMNTVINIRLNWSILILFHIMQNFLIILNKNLWGNDDGFWLYSAAGYFYQQFYRE